jgi:anti-anti-sigma factor
MPVTLDQSEEQCLLRLEGEVDIASAAELKTLLLQALASGTELRVEVERATELDITALQLLWAAEREARGSGRQCTLAGRVSEELMAAASEAGFEKFPVPIDSKAAGPKEIDGARLCEG